MKILHVITGLEVGGAETMLLRLLTDPSPGLRHSVVSLTGSAPIGPRLEAAGVPVSALGMRGILDLPRAVRAVRRAVRREASDVVQSWLYHADLVAGLATWGVDVPVVWNLRHTDLSAERNKRTTLWVVRACARLSHRVPARIISCSAAAAAVHAAGGYDGSRMTVIPNGFDTDTFRPDPESRIAVRRELGLAGEATLVGTVGRFHPQKDPGTLLAAAARVLPDRPNAHLLLVGRGYTADNGELVDLIGHQKLRDRVHLLGPRDDIPRLDAALDVFVSASAGEGFPNAVGEAMACGVPCVATAVGDTPELVGDAGYLVSPMDPGALAVAWADLLDLGATERAALGQRARKRIERCFALESSRARYRQIWDAVAR